jgi:hypothetical protein
MLLGERVPSPGSIGTAPVFPGKGFMVTANKMIECHAHP